MPFRTRLADHSGISIQPDFSGSSDGSGSGVCGGISDGNGSSDGGGGGGVDGSEGWFR